MRWTPDRDRDDRVKGHPVVMKNRAKIERNGELLGSYRHGRSEGCRGKRRREIREAKIRRAFGVLVTHDTSQSVKFEFERQIIIIIIIIIIFGGGGDR